MQMNQEWLFSFETVIMNESFNYSLKQFIKNSDSVQKQTMCCSETQQVILQWLHLKLFWLTEQKYAE